MFSRYMRSSALENSSRTTSAPPARRASPRPGSCASTAAQLFIPIITLLGLSLPAVVSGAVVVESVFNYPGMGLLFWNGATTHDYPLLLGFTVVVAVAIVLGSLLADLSTPSSILESATADVAQRRVDISGTADPR